MQTAPNENTATLIDQKLNYLNLTTPQLNHYEPVNIFGVVIEIPQPIKKNDNWILHLKLVDQSLNQRATKQEAYEDNIHGMKQSMYSRGNTKINSFAIVTFFANKKEHLPLIYRLGDIVRIQKCHCKGWKGQRQFNVNVYNDKSEWAVFQGPLFQNTQE